MMDICTGEIVRTDNRQFRLLQKGSLCSGYVDAADDRVMR